jgi:hypothetical protein
MARRSSLTSQLYKLARLSPSGRALRTGHTERQAKNVTIGRALRRADGWRRLWR